LIFQVSRENTPEDLMLRAQKLSSTNLHYQCKFNLVKLA